MDIDINKLTAEEQSELLRLLEERECSDPPTITFTVESIGSHEPVKSLPPIYPTWWKGWEWWNALPTKERRELIAKDRR